MVVAYSEQRSTVEEYLATERASEERHEYIDGQVYLRAGESPEHGIICTNLTRIVSIQLLGSPCVTFSKGTKVRSGPNPQPGRSSRGLYSYPDLLVVCGEMQFHDEHQDVLLNPTVIIEALSPTTEAFDRGEKFLRYQTWNPTLTDYVLVSQSSPIIEHFSRQADGSWSFRVYQGLGQSLTIHSINCALQLAKVYDRIVFPAEPADEIDDSHNDRN